MAKSTVGQMVALPTVSRRTSTSAPRIAIPAGQAIHLLDGVCDVEAHKLQFGKPYSAFLAGYCGTNGQAHKGCAKRDVTCDGRVFVYVAADGGAACDCARKARVAADKSRS